MPYPPMRLLEALQVEHDGQPLIVLQDPEGLCEEQVAVSLPFFLVISLMDGRSEGCDIQRELMRLTGGQIIALDQIDQIAAEADKVYLLENARAVARRAGLEREFEALAARPACHAGHSYPDDPEECRAFFSELFQGLPRSDGAAAGRRPRGLILPHIDLRIGGRAIARGLASLDPARPPRLYVILGVAHRPTRNLFTLTDKSFQTPLGLARTDRRAADRLRELYGAGRLDGAIAHKTEHSVEFAAVALRHLHGQATDFAILPILCGSLTDEIEPGGSSPLARPEVGGFVQALRTLFAEYEGDVCIIASVDLSHVGIKFGEMEGVDDERAQAVGEADRRMLGLVERMDPEGFFDHFRQDGNARNVDAVTAVYVLLHTLGGGACETIVYEQWREQETDSMVSYASLVIY